MVSGPDGALIREPSNVIADEPRMEEVEWAGHRLEVRVRELAPLTAPEPVPQDEERYQEAGACKHPQAVVVPSAVEGTGKAGDLEKLGARITVAGSPEWRTVGEVFHGFLAAHIEGTPPIERLEIARDLIERWGLAGEIRPEDLVATADRLRAWIEATWPDARWHREWPLLHRLDSGALVRGSADLVLELDKTFVLIDHKTFPGNAEQARKAAAGFGGQLTTYAEAIEAATGKKLEGAFIHLPVSGMVVEVS